MHNFISFFNILLSVGIITYGLFILLIMVYSKKPYLKGFLKKYTLLGILAVSLIATVSSLIYSNTIGFAPCDLCWYQRIAMYPIALLSLAAIFKRKSVDSMLWQLKTLTLAGGVISLFHNFIYYTNINPIPCSATASCTARYVFELGFATIPLMALVSFGLIFVLLIRYPKQ